MSIEQQIVGILAGIDQLEDDEGYWSTSTGVEFGKQILAGVKTVAQLADDNYKLKREKIRELKNENKQLKQAIHNITPWLSASLSCENNYPCKEYKKACEQLFKLDVDEPQEPIEVYICPHCMYAFPASELQKTIAEFERAIEEWWEDEQSEESTPGRNKYDTDDDLPKFVKLAGCTL